MGLENMLLHLAFTLDFLFIVYDNDRLPFPTQTPHVRKLLLLLTKFSDRKISFSLQLRLSPTFDQILFQNVFI